MIPAGGAPSANGNGNGTLGSPPPASAGTPQPATVAPGPVPMTFQVGQAQGTDGKAWAVLICHGPTGVHHMFLDPASAHSIGEALLAVARAGNIQLPPPGLILG